MGPMQREQHTWEQERRRDASSEFPSTSFSTISGELRESATARPQPRRRLYLSLLLPFVLVLIASLLGLLALAKHFHG